MVALLNRIRGWSLACHCLTSPAATPLDAQSFSWLKQPWQWMALVLLLASSIALGIWAEQPALNYQLDIGLRDTPFVQNVNVRELRTDVNPQRSLRWLRNGSAIVIPGVSASHPLTVSIYAGGGERPEAQAGTLSFTLTVNDHSSPVSNCTSRVAGTVGGLTQRQLGMEPYASASQVLIATAVSLPGLKP